MIKKIKYFIFIFSPLLVFGQSGTPCDINSIRNWSTAFLKGGVFECSDWETVLNEEFEDEVAFQNDWQTFWGNGPTPEDHRVGRSFGQCDENLWLDENVEINNGQCIIHGKYEPGSEWTNGVGETFVRDFTTGVIMANQPFQLGRFETTIAEMPGKGWHATFWMWHHEEIDIMERFNEEFEYKYSSLTVRECNDINVAQIDDLTENTNPISLFEGPHKPAADLTPFKITFYYNDIKLPEVVYRFYNSDGTPLDIDCGGEIPEGNYFINPNFPKLYRKKLDDSGNVISLEPKYFKPRIDMDALPKFGLQCCPEFGPNVYCDDPRCNLDCSNWGNPIMNGIERPGYEANSKMIIENVKVETRVYTACNSLLVFMDGKVCENQETIITVEDLGSQSRTYLVDNLSVTSSSNIEVISIINHEIKIVGLTSGPGNLLINYTDKCNNSNSISYPINILSNELAPCSINQETFKMDIFPNPASDETTIYFSGLIESSKLEIIGIGGHVHYSTFLEKDCKQIQIPTHRLTAGLYFIKINNANSNITKKLVVKN